MYNGETSGKKAIARRAKMLGMLEMRKAGATLDEIGAHYGCSHTYVSNLIQKALREITAELALDVIGLELARLDALWLKAYARATAEGKAFNKESMDACIRIMERRAKLLGIDKPTKVANTNVEGDKEMEQVQFYIPDNGRTSTVLDET